MSYVVSFLLIIFSVSLDGFTVGISYGLRNIRIAVAALLVIMCCSGIVVFSSMTIGKLIRHFLSVDISQKIGGLILIFLGLFIIFSQRKTNVHYQRKKRQHVIRAIINDPTIADQDHSGNISVRESFLLGIALALDAFGAGFATAMLGYSPIITALFIALMSGFFVFIGLKIGNYLAQKSWVQRFVYLPAIILISIGLSTFI